MRITPDLNRELLCKDCVFSQASAWNRIFKNSHFFKCHNPASWNEEDFDPVNGKMTPGYFSSCSGMRITKCGPDAKLWEPANSTKDLFLRIKHER